MNQHYRWAQFSDVLGKLIMMVIGSLLLNTGCTRSTEKPAPQAEPSNIHVAVNNAGPLILTTNAAEFRILESGSVQAFLLKDGSKLTLDEPGSFAGDHVVHDGKEIHFKLDFSQAKVNDAGGKLGRGKHVEIPAQPIEAPSLQRKLLIDAYDDFPNLLLTSSVYTNTAASDYRIDKIIEQQHQFDSHVPKKSYEMWSFQGSSYEWGKDDVLKLTNGFSQPNLMGGMVKGGYGGGIPVVAFWTGSVGE